MSQDKDRLCGLNPRVIHLDELAHFNEGLPPFTGSEQTGFELDEEAFIAKQAADSQHMTMSEMKASLGHPASVDEVADTERLPFSGAAQFNGAPLTSR